MKFVHLADIHFGKQLHGLSLIDDQKAWCAACEEVLEKEQPDAVVIAGDVYDRSQPGGEARKLCSDFLTALTHRLPVLMIAGNHGSGENIEYLSDLVRENGLYVSGNLSKSLKCVTLRDAYGPVHFWLLPYFFPALVRDVLEREETFSGYTEACRALLEQQSINTEERNVLVAHQLVLNGSDAPEMGGSETTVGGVGQIDFRVFDAFDYVALGHIHKGQAIGRQSVRYAGSPLCYHFGEAGKTDEGNAKKGMQIIEIGEKGSEILIRQVPVRPLHPLRNIEGALEAIEEAEQPSGKTGEYLHVRLTDEVLPVNVQERLRTLFEARGSKLLWLDRVTHRAQDRDFRGGTAIMQEKSPEEHFLQYYQDQRPDTPISPVDQQLVHFLGELMEQSPEDPPERLAGKLMQYALEVAQ